MNGYFQIINETDKTSLKLVPATEDGQNIQLNDIMNYLDAQNIKEFNLLEVNRCLNGLKEEVVVEISNKPCFPVNEYMKLRLAEDKMAAYATFFPASNDGVRVNMEEMKNDLQIAGIRHGINEMALKAQVVRPCYCTEVLIAEGKSVVEGKDAYIEYNFDVSRKAKPKRNEDGSVDFHQLDNINHICQGDLLATLHPAIRGEHGIAVTGEIVRPASVENKMLRFGKNIEISDDKLRLYSKVAGHVMMFGDQVFVYDVYDVPADVDTATGDIEYEGNVLVHGSVRTGFKIRATGNIEVMGAVEGAELISGGDVILHHGMQGMTKGKIVAKGNIITKFIESSRVFAGGYIEANAIIQSQVSAVDEITVVGSKGKIVGGHIRSAKMIRAKMIGSAMGIATTVEVGYNPGTLDDINKKKTLIQTKGEELKKDTQLLEVLTSRVKKGAATEEVKVNYEKLLKRIDEIKEEIAQAEKEQEEKQQELIMNSDARIKVERTIYPGTQLVISDVHYHVEKEDNYCEFVKKNGEVVCQPL